MHFCLPEHYNFQLLKITLSFMIYRAPDRLITWLVICRHVICVGHIMLSDIRPCCVLFCQCDWWDRTQSSTKGTMQLCTFTICHNAHYSYSVKQWQSSEFKLFYMGFLTEIHWVVKVKPIFVCLTLHFNRLIPNNLLVQNERRQWHEDAAFQENVMLTQRSRVLSQFKDRGYSNILNIFLTRW